ncbi:hypothetical protein SAMN05444673_0442 [Bacillus sp. OV166]|uniref:hypothetical protein n=1 Tax=Bacillus sp. OV166 TaxID=1882763 RepID=UPI000A2AB5E6|nr:hypothetical protein [Bacillus sp. OV166]SMQ60936.1 hypothetical protein SAMN05444673_0442 [Bacillus sp. OV166]
MSLKLRLAKIEKRFIDERGKLQENSGEDIISDWLINNCHEYRECIRQLFRLQCKVNQSVDDWQEWTEPYRSSVEKILLCMEDLRQKIWT